MVQSWHVSDGVTRAYNADYKPRRVWGRTRVYGGSTWTHLDADDDEACAVEMDTFLFPSVQGLTYITNTQLYTTFMLTQNCTYILVKYIYYEKCVLYTTF